MPVPTIDPQSSIPFWPQWQSWEHLFSASNAPTSWAVNSGGLPPGMSFEPVLAATGVASTDVITATGHAFTNGMTIMFRDLTGGSGLATGTLYYVRDVSGATFKLAASSSGAAINFTTDISAANIYRPGQLTGAATLPGLYKLRLTATNGSGASAEVLYVIGIYPAAPSLDGNLDVIWDLDTGLITRQNYSTLPTVAPVAGAPVFTSKEGDDMMVRLRLRKGGTIIDLAATNLRQVMKELETEGEITLSDAWIKEGTGTGASYLVHSKFLGDALAAALGNYEADTGTFYDGLGEFEITYSNPEAIGPEELVLSSATFKHRIERDIADGPTE